MAATKIKTRLQEEIEQKTNQFLSETVSFVEGAVSALAERGIEKGLEKGAEVALEAVAKGTFETVTFALDCIEKGAKVINWVVGWGDAYDAAQALMTISTMDASMDILGTLKKEDSQYVAELWGYLQMMGCEKAEAFLNEWEKANWLSTKEFGIGKDKLPSAIQQITNEKNSYQSFINQRQI